MKKYIILILTLSLTLLFTGCTLTKKNKSEEKEKISSVTQEEKKESKPKAKVDSNGNIIGEELSLSDSYAHPQYYQDDYDVDFGKSTMKDSGNMVTCLTTVYSHFTNIDVTPDIFYEAFKDDIDEFGCVDDKIFDKVAEKANTTLLYSGAFDFPLLCEYLEKHNAVAILQINHASKYSDYASCMVTNGSDGLGLLRVYNPVKANQEFLIHSDTEDGLPYYNLSEVVESVGSSGTMYVFGQEEAEEGVIRDEE